MVTMELSLDLVEEILLRVPAQYLAPLRYVCKQWKTLISDPRFVKKHLSNFREQQFRVFSNVSESTTFDATCKVLSTVSCVGINFNELNNIPSLNVKVLKPWDNMLVRNVSHCDGLLLLVTACELLVLNPLLKQGRWIKSVRQFHYSMDVCGLGYASDQQSSSIWYDYKIVMFRCTSYDEKDLSVYIYDFNSAVWKDIVGQNFEEFRRFPKENVCLGGTPYWLCYHESKLLIRSFDFSKERFEALCDPFETIDYVSSLGIYRGDHLSLLRKSRTTGSIEIWVMMMKKQWSKLIIIDIPEFRRFGPLLMYFIEKKDGKFVISVFQPGNGIVNIYILGENQKGQKFEYKLSTDPISKGYYYVPSLIPVPMPLNVRRKRPRENS